MRRFFSRPQSDSVTSREQEGGGKSPAAGLSRAERRRRVRRAAARRRSAPLKTTQEQLEPRIALAVNVAGYEDAVDFFLGSGDEIDASGSGYRVGPHSPQHFVHGRAVIASDDGDDVFIRQVASVTQDLIVSNTSNFLNYQIIDGIDERYQQIFVTNGTRRVETNPIQPDFGSDSAAACRFMLSHSNIELDFVPANQLPTGTIFYQQSDGQISQWTWTMDRQGAGTITSGPGFGAPPAPLPAGYIRPLTLTLVQGGLFNVDQSAIDITWSDPPVPGRLLSMTLSYTYLVNVADPGVTFQASVTETVSATQAFASTQLQFTLPGALATQQDGISLRQSLGVIPGTFRGEQGAISVTWTDGGRYALPAFRADVDGVLRFNTFLAPRTYTESVYKDSSTYIQPVDMGVIDIRGFVSTSGVVTLDFRRWNDLDNDTFTDELGRGWTGFEYVNPRGLLGVPGPVTIDDVSYLTYTRDTEPNTATFIAGQTISREVTVDLLTPGSTINVDSPIVVNTDPPQAAFPKSATSYFQSVNAEGLQLPDIDLRATNINIRATTTAPDRFSIGRSQIARERLSIPRDDVNPYLLSPSMPSLYDRDPPEAPILPNSGFPEIRTAQAIAAMAGGQVIGLTPLPGYQGFGYDPDNPPTVTIVSDPLSPPAVQATARAIVGRDGTITGYLITNPGSGYTTIPAVTVTAPIAQSRATARVAEINAATGQVVRIDVLDRGYRYHAPPRVVVSPPGQTAFGVRATARAVLDSEGRIDRIEVVDPGFGYSERPEVTIAEPSPPAMAERLLLDAQVRANIYELYVGDDFGTETPRGLAKLSANGTLATQPTRAAITSIVPTPIGQQATDQQVILGGVGNTALPAGFNPVGSVISGIGIREGTRVLAYNPTTFTATLALDSVNPALRLPIVAEFSVRADSLYLEATIADVYFEGLVNVNKQSYLFNSPPSAAYLAPFVFTTRSSVTGSQTGQLEGGVVDIILGNDAPTPLTGSTAEHVMDLRTRVDSLRVRAGSSATNPQGPYPYRLTVEEQASISIDALAASSLPISISSLNEIQLTSGVDTDGDLSLNAQSLTGDRTRLRVTAPIRTRFGKVAIAADTVEIRNSLVVSSAAVVDGRQDVVLEARGGNLVLQGEVSAPNDVVLEQVDRVDEVEFVQVRSVNPVAPEATEQTIVLAFPDGSDLPTIFDPTGVTIRDVFPGTFINAGAGAQIVAWNNVTRTATLRLTTTGVPIVSVGVPAFQARFSRIVTAVTPGEIDGALSRVIADEVSILAEGKVSLRTDVNRLTATAGRGFVLSELNDISIPLLASGGLVSLEALGVDQGPLGANPVALSARLFDVTNLTVNVPNGSVRINANTDLDLLVGDAASLQKFGDRAPTMLAAGDVTIRSQSGDVVLLDAPIAGGNARAVRVATSRPLPATATYLPGTPGVMPSTLSGAGSINALSADPSNPFWGRDAQERPITLAVGDLVLVKDQQSKDTSLATVNPARENGVYRVAAVGGGAFGSQRWQLVRDAASDTVRDMPNGTLVRVTQGTYAEDVFTIKYDAIVPTLVERIGTNQLQFAELFPSFDLLKVGGIVNGTGIAPDSYITAIDPVARVVTLDVVRPGQVFDSGLGQVGVDSTSGGTIFLDPSFTDYALLSLGQQVTGPGVLPDTVITGIDPVGQSIDVAVTVLGPAVVSLDGTTLEFDPAPTDPVFTQFSQLKVGQQVRLYDAEANLLGTQSITAINPVVRQVTLDGTVAGTPATARIWTPGALPAVFSRPIQTPRATSVVLAADNELARVRVGQLIQLRDSGANAIGGPQAVTSVNVRVGLDGVTVFGDVTIGFGTILTAGQIAAAVGGTIDFLPPDAVEFGLAGPGAVPVTWNTWTAENEVLGSIQSVAGSTATLAPSTQLFGVETPVDVPWMDVGNNVEFLDASDAVLGTAAVIIINRGTRQVTFSAPVPAGATQLRVFSRVLTLPNFAEFDELSALLEVFGPNIPAGAVLVANAVDARGQTITINANPTGPTSAVSFGIGPPARYPASDTLRLDAGFTNYERLFEGQRVYGDGIREGAVIVSIDRVAGTVMLTPGSVGTDRGPIRVVQRDSLRSPYYPERFDDWVELDDRFNDFAEIKIGQRAALFDDAGDLIGVARVTGVDARYRTVGFENGSLNGLAVDIDTVRFLPVSDIRFGVIEGVGSGMTELLFQPVGLAAITVEARDVTTNIGTDLRSRTATFVASTDGRTNDATGSLGKMIGVYQNNDTSRTQVDLGVSDVSRELRKAALTSGSIGTSVATLSAATPAEEAAAAAWLAAAVPGVSVRFLDAAGDVLPDGVAEIVSVDAALKAVAVNREVPTGAVDVEITTWKLRLDPLFTAYERLQAIQAAWSELPVYGTPRMFTNPARLVAVDEVNQMITLSDGLSPLAVEELTRVTFVTLPIQTTNPDQDQEFRFWNWMTGTIQLQQELPIIRRTMTIDGALVNADGGTGAPRLGPILIDGQRINRNRSGGVVTTGQQINGFEIVGEGADGSKIARLAVGGYTQGSAVKIEGSSHVVVESVNVGRRTDNSRFPNARGVTVVGQWVPNDDVLVSAAEDNTILNSTVVGGLSAGVVVEQGANRTYVIGGSIGTATIDNEVGIFVAGQSVSTGRAAPIATSIGANPILPGSPLSTTASFTAGSNAISLPAAVFNSPLIGLQLAFENTQTAAPVPAGTSIIGIDSVARVAFLSNAATASRSAAFRIGHVAQRLQANGDFDEVQLPASVPLEDVYVGQTLSGTGLVSGTQIIAIDRATRIVQISRPFATTGAGLVSFGAPAQTVVQGNRRGIILRGEDSRVTNSAVFGNDELGIDILSVGQQIGSTAVFAEIGTGTIPLASWPVNVTLSTTTSVVQVPSSFTGTAADIPVGTPVYGPGIAVGTTVAAVTPATGTLRSITLSQRPLSSRSSTIAFAVTGGGLTIAAAEYGSLFVGQDVHAEGLPEFSQVTALRLTGTAGDYVAVSAPSANQSVRNFAALAAGSIVFAERSAASNRFYNNGQYGILVRHADEVDYAGAQNTRIFANYFGMTDETRDAAPNRLGSIRYSLITTAPPYPSRHLMRPASRVDLFSNKYGLGENPDDPNPPPPPPPPGGGNGSDPLPPGDPAF